MVTNILHVKRIEELDEAANDARVIAFGKTNPDEQLVWRQIAWALETKAMHLRIAQTRRAS